MKNSSQLLKFTELCMRLATQHVPLYSSKKHLFTQTQLITLYGLEIVVAAVLGAGGGVLVYNLERAVKLGVSLLDRLWACLLYFLQRRISTEHIYSNSVCSSCWIRHLCGGGCPHVNLMVNGSLRSPDQDICKWFQYALSETMKLLAELRDAGEDHIIQRIYQEGTGRQFDQSDIHA